MRPIIEFCQSNLAAGTQRVKEKLENDSNLDVIEYGCLGFCGQCYESPYALVNGTIVTGKTPKTLLENIYKQLEEEDKLL